MRNVLKFCPHTPQTIFGLPLGEVIALGAVLLLALALRLWVSVDTEYLVHPDETYDFLEQGFRLAFGYGVKTWTYEDGVRSYVFPAVLAAVMRLSAVFAEAPSVYLAAVASLMGLLSLSIVVSAFFWGRHVGGLAGALITGVLAAIWFELIYFGPRTLSEVLSTDALVPGVFFVERWRSGHSRHWLNVGGALLGCAFLFRMQVAPALAIVGGWVLWQHGWRVLMHVILAALVPTIAGGILDWATYSYPFESTIQYFLANTMGGVSAYYGHRPFYYLIDIEVHYLRGAIALVGLGCLIGALEFPLLILIAASIVIAHSFVGWKEYRFIYPALPFVVILLGVATSRVVALVSKTQSRLGIPALCTIAIGFWSVTSATLAFEGPFRREWFRGSGEIDAARFIAAQQNVCGIGGYGMPLSALGGYVRLHHDVPLYVVSRPERFAQDAESFNVVIANDDNFPPKSAFQSRGCWSNGYYEGSFNRRLPHVCVLMRPGECHPGAVSDPDVERPPGW